MDSTWRDTNNYRMILVVLILTFISFSFVSKGYADSKFPNRPINFYNPFPPGGAIDIVTRPLAESTSKILGQPIIITNKPGASGTLAPTMLKAMRPDGYNISIAVVTLLYIPLQRDVPFDPLKDFTYICRTAGIITALCVKSDSPWKTLKDFMEYAKANPGKIKYSSPGHGGTPHLAMSEIALKEGIKWEIVPYQGGGQSAAALLGGHVQASCANALDLGPHVESGELRMLATLGEERSKRFPYVPCFKELGYISYPSPMGIIGPAGMPKDIVDILDGAFKKALYESEVQKVYEGTDSPLLYMNSTDYTNWVKEAYGHYSNVVRAIGLGKK